MRTAVSPSTRDRLAGRYFSQCPNCRTGRHLGPDCGGSGPVPARARRKTERRSLDRYVADELGATPYDPLLDPSDCIHGCAGGRYGCSDHCNFTCHEDDDA